MTDDRFEAVHTDLDGDELQIADDAGDSMLRVEAAEDGRGWAVRVPRRVADAIRTALAVDDSYAVTAVHKDAVLADIAPLLAQCDREDTNPRPESRFLNTREIRHLLGLASPCGQVERALAGARCTLPEHGSDTWHVDPDKRLRWRHNAEKELDVRGWTPDTADDEAPPMTEDEEVARTAAVLDRHGAPDFLDATHCRDFLKEHGLLGPIPVRIMRRVVTMRQTRGTR